MWSWLAITDENNPLSRSYRHYWLQLKQLGTIVAVLVLMAWLIGVPHLLTSYRYTGPRPANGIPRTERKIDGWYVSVTGWQHVHTREYGQEGCPVILFIPLGDCLGVDWL